jgi:hypothetical protein
MDAAMLRDMVRLLSDMRTIGIAGVTGRLCQPAAAARSGRAMWLQR